MALTAPTGPMYFNMSMKDAKLPTLKGKVVKLEPENKPKTMVLAMEDGAIRPPPTRRLKFEMPLAGKVDAGTELTFEGVAGELHANPFMVVFNVDKDNLHGWTGKNAPRRCTAPARRKLGGEISR